MIDKLRIRYNQFMEEAKEKSPRDALRKALSTCVQLNRIVVPVYKDLSKLKQPGKTEETTGLEFVVVNSANAATMAPMNKAQSRKLKGPYNTRAGYYAYAVVCNGEIIGDIWCATPQNIPAEPIHPDLDFLGISCGKDEAYMFDMYVAPDSRGKVITAFLLSNALKHLKESGFQRAYGFYEKENLPALWTHRLFGYTELGKRKVTRLLLYQNSEPLAAAAAK
jgi:GNAT superfamily N-acetyltransferase